MRHEVSCESFGFRTAAFESAEMFQTSGQLDQTCCGPPYGLIVVDDRDEVLSHYGSSSGPKLSRNAQVAQETPQPERLLHD